MRHAIHRPPAMTMTMTNTHTKTKKEKFQEKWGLPRLIFPKFLDELYKFFGSTFQICSTFRIFQPKISEDLFLGLPPSLLIFQTTFLIFLTTFWILVFFPNSGLLSDFFSFLQKINFWRQQNIGANMIGCQKHIYLTRTADQYRLLEDNEPTRVTLVPPKFGGQKIGGTNLVAKSAPHPACKISNDANLWEMWKKGKFQKSQLNCQS